MMCFPLVQTKHVSNEWEAIISNWRYTIKIIHHFILAIKSSLRRAGPSLDTTGTGLEPLTLKHALREETPCGESSEPLVNIRHS